jgi:hypothetical protein
VNSVNPRLTLTHQHIYLTQFRDNLFRFVSFRCHFRSSVSYQKRWTNSLGTDHFPVVSLPRSDEIFVKGYPAKTSEAFCDGHVAAFAFFGGVPRSILYDNTRLAVAKILGDGTRKRSTLLGLCNRTMCSRTATDVLARVMTKGKSM